MSSVGNRRRNRFGRHQAEADDQVGVDPAGVRRVEPGPAPVGAVPEDPDGWLAAGAEPGAPLGGPGVGGTGVGGTAAGPGGVEPVGSLPGAVAEPLPAEAGGAAAPLPAEAVGVAPADPALADPAVAEPTAPPRSEGLGHTRVSGVWAALISAAVVLLLLLIFILQNGKNVRVTYFGAAGTLPLGVALLLGAVAGALLVALAGIARIVQLRRVARRRGGEPAHRTTRPRRAGRRSAPK